MIFDLMQYVGAGLVLLGFTANARGWLAAGSTAYLLINFVGAGLLFASAYAASQWGFFVLNVVWSAVALVGLAQLRRGGGEARAAGSELRGEVSGGSQQHIREIRESRVKK